MWFLLFGFGGELQGVKVGLEGIAQGGVDHLVLLNAAFACECGAGDGG